MKNIFFVVLSLVVLTSCNEAYRALGTARSGSSILAGKTTSYTGDYTFVMDSVVVENPLRSIENYMQDKNWTISRESNTFMNFEYDTTSLSRQTTGRVANGTANFSIPTDEQTIELLLRLRGNYQFGTKKKSLDIYNDLRSVLYGIELETSKKKKKSKSN